MLGRLFSTILTDKTSEYFEIYLDYGLHKTRSSDTKLILDIVEMLFYRHFRSWHIVGMHFLNFDIISMNQPLYSQ